jgi:hypothetical protein
MSGWLQAVSLAPCSTASTLSSTLSSAMSSAM